MIRLHSMTDTDFAWLMGENGTARDFRIADGGIAPREVIALVRRVTRETAETTDSDVSWMIVHHDEVVGMISCTKPAGHNRFEIGYGIAPSREGRGHTSAAVAAMLVEARHQGFAGLTAETSVANPGSQRVLEKNGFKRTGTRHDEEDGDLICWGHDLEMTQ